MLIYGLYFAAAEIDKSSSREWFLVNLRLDRSLIVSTSEDTERSRLWVITSQMYGICQKCRASLRFEMKSQPFLLEDMDWGDASSPSNRVVDHSHLSKAWRGVSVYPRDGQSLAKNSLQPKILFGW